MRADLVISYGERQVNYSIDCWLASWSRSVGGRTFLPARYFIRVQQGRSVTVDGRRLNYISRWQGEASDISAGKSRKFAIARNLSIELSVHYYYGNGDLYHLSRKNSWLTACAWLWKNRAEIRKRKTVQVGLSYHSQRRLLRIGGIKESRLKA